MSHSADPGPLPDGNNRLWREQWCARVSLSRSRQCARSTSNRLADKTDWRSNTRTPRSTTAEAVALITQAYQRYRRVRRIERTLPDGGETVKGELDNARPESLHSHERWTSPRCGPDIWSSSARRPAAHTGSSCSGSSPGASRPRLKAGCLSRRSNWRGASRRDTPLRSRVLTNANPDGQLIDGHHRAGARCPHSAAGRAYRQAVPGQPEWKDHNGFGVCQSFIK